MNARHPLADLHPLARLRAWHRLLIATLAGLAVTASVRELWETRLLAGWLAGATLYLALVWWGVGRLDAEGTRRRATADDPGTLALYTLVVAASFVSLAGVLLVTDAARAMQGLARWGHIGLALAALAVTWLLIQTVFALRYAHRYYLDARPGLAFPGGQAPDYLDFAYFAAVIGMTAQVADVGITTAAMRRLVLAHGLISFAFNLLVLALTLNLLASALG
ncbi:MAG: DUF1345 domain-containing protein [Thiobacillaceae bacterium]|nr:DUF1345 domain-containing protein [Thiobacillaceae bacterium]MDW8324156.1 DUF1345 domain-containing protein [Burkholderiales bacterium]